MKIFLRPLLFIVFFSFTLQKANAQCQLTNVVIQNIRNVTPGTGSCTVTFDVSFNIQNNDGNKFIFIHVWLESAYPNYFNCVDGQTTTNGAIHAPEASDLAEAFINIGIDNNTTAPAILTTYPPDPAVPMTTIASISKTVLPDGSANFILSGVTTTAPVPCGTPSIFIADLWSSQSAQAQVAHCVDCGNRYSAGYLSLAGLVNCATMTYVGTYTNATTSPITGEYRVYADINNDGIFSPPSDSLLSGPISFSLAGGVGATTTITGPVPGANLGQGVFIVTTQTAGPGEGASRVIYFPSTTCAPLPVTLRSFTAKRMNINVQLKWETSTEINNKGFVIQRSKGDNRWENIVFMNSQADDGNSNRTLYYTYDDLNVGRNITQYRIQQVDYDGKIRFSEIRTVRGDGQNLGTIVYPNPSRDGRVNIVFEEKEGVRDATLSDMNGRVLNRWRITNGNTIQVSNLLPGVYSIQIMNVQTRATTVEKILVIGSK